MATAAVDTYPAISQRDRDIIKDDTDISEAMERYAQRETVMAKILGLTLGLAVAVRTCRFLRR